MDAASHTLETATRAEPSWREPRQGDVLGRYEILFPLASGGMATVFAARLAGEEGFQKPLALKLMLPHLARDERFVAMFLDEATLASRISSPHVVSTLDLGREGETLFIAMELVLGASLRDLIGALAQRGERMPPRVAATLALQVARGLADAHEARGPTGAPLALVHRDVSPHNVLVGVDGRARLSDFGVALAADRVARTETGEMKGKLSYFSPEQLEGSGIDQRSDVFSLAAVAWECLAGRRLFDATNPLALAAQVARGPIPRVDALVDGVPRPLADVLAAALQRDVSKRTPSARELARALASALAQDGGPVDPEELGAFVRRLAGETLCDVEARLAVCLATPPAWPTSERSAVRSVVGVPRRSRRVATLVGVIALAVCVGVVGALAWTQASTPDAASPPSLPEATFAPPTEPVAAVDEEDAPTRLEPPTDVVAHGHSVDGVGVAEPASSAVEDREVRAPSSARRRRARPRHATAAPPAASEPTTVTPGPTPRAAGPRLLDVEAFDAQRQR